MRGEGLCCETPQERGARMMKEAGYAGGGEVSAPVKRAIKRAVGEHETQEHGGKHSTIKLRSGGEVPGMHAKGRPDRRGSKHTTVNVIVTRGDDQQGKQEAAQQGLRAGVQLGARAAAQRMAGAGGPPPGAMPPGAPPMAPPGAIAGPPRPPMMPPPGAVPPRPMGVKRGGEVTVREHTRRKAGGAVA